MRWDTFKQDHIYFKIFLAMQSKRTQVLAPAHKAHMPKQQMHLRLLNMGQVLQLTPMIDTNMFTFLPAPEVHVVDHASFIFRETNLLPRQKPVATPGAAHPAEVVVRI
jgi:hypothetical protein